MRDRSLSSILREKLTIQAPAHTGDGEGGFDEAWTDLASVWAEVLPTGGKERLEAGSMRGVQGWRVTIRHRTDVTVRHRLNWKGTLLNIASVADPDGRRTRLVLFAESGVAS